MEKYLRKCLDSLIVSEENMQRLEILVINDGSKDTSSQIAHEYEIKYPQTFRVIDKENGNYGSCINRGLKEATGKYVKVLDADDYFETDVFDQFLSYLLSTEVDMILTDYNEVDTFGKVTVKHTIPYPERASLQVNDCCCDKLFIYLQMHAVTYRLSLLKKNNYEQTTGVSYTDQEWMFLPITYMNTFCHYQGFLYQYLVGREGQTIDPTISAKQANVRFNLIYKRIGLYTQLSSLSNINQSKILYLRDRLFDSSYVMYKTALIDDAFSMQMIKEFDNTVRSLNVVFYEEIGASRLCRWRSMDFIGYWRKNNALPFCVRAIKVIYKFVKR